MAVVLASSCWSSSSLFLSPIISTNSAQFQTCNCSRHRKAGSSVGVNNLSNLPQPFMNNRLREEKLLTGRTDVDGEYEHLIFLSTNSVNIGKYSSLSVSRQRKNGALPQQQQITCLKILHLLIRHFLKPVAFINGALWLKLLMPLQRSRTRN